MTNRIVAKEEAIRELVRGALDSGDGKLTTDEPTNVSPVVDPSAAQTDPINPNFVPRTKQELDLTLKNLIKNLPDDKMPGIYKAIKQAIDADKELNSQEETMKNTQGTNQKNHVEEAVRKAVRGYLINKKVRAALTEAPIDPADIQADEEESEFDAEGKPRKFSTMTDVGGGTFEEIAKELNFSVAGAKQAVDKALKKAQFLGKIDKDELDIMVLTTMNDYIKMLAKTGELTGADVQLMKDHPDIVRELDGFREYLHNAVRRMRKSMGDDETMGESTDSKKKCPACGNENSPNGKKALGGRHQYDCSCGEQYHGKTVIDEDDTGDLVGKQISFGGGKAKVHEPSKEKPKKLSDIKLVGESARPRTKVVQVRDLRRKPITEANTAAKVAAHKKLHPELYCPKCLFKTGGGACSRHGGKPKK